MLFYDKEKTRNNFQGDGTRAFVKTFHEQLANYRLRSKDSKLFQSVNELMEYSKKTPRNPNFEIDIILE